MFFLMFLLGGFMNSDSHQLAPGFIFKFSDGSIEKLGAEGLANLEFGLPISEETVFPIASLRKQFIGYGIARLIEKRPELIDMPITRWFPFFKIHPGIKVKHLLYHTSGIRDFIFVLLAKGHRYEDVFYEEDIRDVVFRQETLNFAPGTRFDYSNSGYWLLEKILEIEVGKTFAEWMDENVFKPLEMHNSRVVTDPQEWMPFQASCYHEESGQWKKFPYSSPGIYSTVNDLGKWAHFLLSTDQQSVKKIMFKPGSLDSGFPLNYAFGFRRLGDVLAHDGDIAAFGATIGINLESKAWFVGLANTNAISLKNERKKYIPEPKVKVEMGSQEEKSITLQDESIIGVYASDTEVIEIFKSAQSLKLRFLIHESLGPKFELPILGADKNEIKIKYLPTFQATWKQDRISRISLEQDGVVYHYSLCTVPKPEPKEILGFCREVGGYLRLKLGQENTLEHPKLGEFKLVHVVGPYFRLETPQPWMQWLKTSEEGFLISNQRARNLSYPTIPNPWQ